MINLGWGHSPTVRRAFLDTYNGQVVWFDNSSLMSMDYPEHEGDPDLIELTRKVIKRQIGKSYRHVLLTHGATGAIDVTLRAYHERGIERCATRQPPYYTRYPGQIKAAGLTQTFGIGKLMDKTVTLLDLPANPTGSVESPVVSMYSEAVILDAVYLNGVYSHTKIPAPEHDVLIGSYSKLLGINGIRVGWIATNDALLYERMRELVTVEYCGLSTANTVILKSILKNLDWDSFEKRGRKNLDNNRDEWSRLEKFFEHSIPDVGMFHYTRIDKKVQKLFAKAEVSYLKGSVLGTDDNHARFNLGADNLVIRDVVRKIKTLDKIKK